MNEYVLEVLADMIRRELLDPERVPIHEAGHAVVAHYHRFRVTKITVQPNSFPDDPDNLYTGQVTCDPPWPEDDEATYATWHTRARTMAEASLAGRAAEIEKFGELQLADEDGHTHDLAVVYHLLEVLYAPKTEAEIRAYVERAESRARGILRQHWPTVTYIAAQAQDHCTLDQKTIQELLEGVPRRARWESDKRWTKKLDSEWGDYYGPIE